MHWIIRQLLAIGLSTRDLEKLEYLTDAAVLKRMPAENRHPQRNRQSDVVMYLEVWADLLDAELALAELNDELIMSKAVESIIFDSQD